MLFRSMLGRTMRGRVATRKAYEHLGLAPPARSPPDEPQGTLF